MSQVLALLTQLVETVRPFAYALVFLGTLLETLPVIGLIIPGGLITVFGGFLVYHGSADGGDMVAFAVAGAFFGDWLAYGLGRSVHLVSRAFPLERVVKVRRALDYVNRRGGWGLVYSRFLPPLRGLVPLAAGVAGMPQRWFLLFNLVGAIAWATIHVVVGYLAGHSWRVAARYVGGYTLALFVLLPAAYYVARALVRRWRAARPTLA